MCLWHFPLVLFSVYREKLIALEESMDGKELVNYFI